jgi:hypothetical protein
MEPEEQEAFDEYMNQIQQNKKSKKKKGGQMEESPRLSKQAAAGVVSVPRVQFIHENTEKVR